MFARHYSLTVHKISLAVICHSDKCCTNRANIFIAGLGLATLYFELAFLVKEDVYWQLVLIRYDVF